MLPFDHRKSPDAGSDDDADSGSILVGDLEPRVFQRHGGRRKREVDEEVEFLDLFLFDPILGFEALDLGPDMNREVRGVESRDGGHPAGTGSQAPAQVGSVPIPRGETRPTPVTTTRRDISQPDSASETRWHP